MKKNTLLLSMGALALLASCSSINSNTLETNEKFQVMAPLVADTVYTSEYVAEINALQNVEVRARAKGFIEAIHADEGQTVRKGQALFTLSRKEHEQQLQSAKAATQLALAELKSAEIELENMQKLFDKNIVSVAELELAKALAEGAKANVAEAQSEEAQAALNLSFTEIKAPFDGIINRIPNKAGSLVEEGALLTTISNNEEVLAYFNVSEKEYLDFVTSKQDGRSKEVSLVLANNTLYAHKGIIETIESEIDRSTGNIAFRAKFPNPEQILKHGSSGKVQVKTQLKNAMLVPQKSTFEIQENIYVFKVDASNTVKLQQIVPSVRLPHLYVIASGLSPQDKFIYEGIQRVKQGDLIQPETLLLSQILVP